MNAAQKSEAPRGTVDYRSPGAAHFHATLPVTGAAILPVSLPADSLSDSHSPVSSATLDRPSPGVDGARAAALDGTMLAPHSMARQALSTAAEARLTVLPRLEIVGDEPRLVLDSRLRFAPERKLGEGGLGEVMGVVDQDIGRRVAVKRLRADVKSQAALVRFTEEIRTIGKLEHPNIIPIHDVGLDEQGDHYFVMKYVDGETLESIIEKLAAGDPETHALYPYERRAEIFLALLEAVAFAHSRGVIHRDIKPANVMIGQYGEVVLMDWGIAKNVGGPEHPAALPADISSSNDVDRRFETQVGSLLGTPAYMSPEQAQGLPADERTDVYALSVLFHEFLTLKHYLDDARTLDELLQGVIHTPARHPVAISSPHQPPVPADLNWFVMPGLQKDPQKRYPSVDAMIIRLRLRAVGKIPIQCHITFLKRLTNEFSRFVDRHPLVTTALLAAMVLAFAFALVLSGLSATGLLRS